MQLKLSFVAGLIAASSLVSAAPVEQERGLNIDIEKRGNLKVAGTDQIDWSKVDAHMNGLRAKYQKSLANFEKNTGKVHPSKRDLPEHLAKRATGSVGLTDQQNGELWTGTMAYGTPAQSFSIDFDTGSSDTLVNPGAYTPSSSSTSRTSGDTFSTSYGDGTTASGTIYTDTVRIGGLSATNTAIGVSNQQFIDSSEGSSGISGMAFPQLAAFGSKYLPYFFRLKQAGAVSSGVFQFDLRTSGSSLFLGGTNSAKYSSTPQYVSVDSNNGFWQVPATVNGQSIQSIVDTGTTIIVAPTSQAQTLFKSLGLPTFTQDGSTYAYYNCNSPPKVTFKYGSYTKTLSAATTSFGTTNSGQCVLSVAGSDIGINAWVTGDSYLQNTVAIFDTDNNRVGFANKA
ncbi:related to pepsin precursor (aspartate protease) [Ustilago trichophora]|uniref:Related to pepsin (Aspartate protease) n=1 Tax=Ustilago trichophora TaxID=86804 RepID=A0A5C3DQF1_9BASI|nr:related to pepsin precursor (aspartate protease) [Ustilago trichophora]